MRLPFACGQLVVGGFAGKTLSPSYRSALARGERGGAVLFKRNVGATSETRALAHDIADATGPEAPPLIAVDQEGGRVARLGPPVMRLPPMRALGKLGSADLAFRAARVLGEQLLALGFNMNFAPVLDVDTRAENPIIGDRSFSASADVVRELAHAFARGLQAGGVMACGKHFPGHGDTTVDSHLDLPVVGRSRAELERVELLPFRGLRKDACAAVMTAHVVYPALDGQRPATLSGEIVDGLLRRTLGYDGLAISDDLEMRAVADRAPIEETAVAAVVAGCDVLLVCSSEELADRAHAALVRAAESDSRFRERVLESAKRVLDARRAFPLRSSDWSATLEARGEAVEIELEARGAFDAK